MATTRPRRARPRPDRAAVRTRPPAKPARATSTRPRRPAPIPAVAARGARRLVTPENQAILHHALEEAARLLHSDGALAYLLDPATGVLRFADDAGITDDQPPALGPLS